MLLPFRRCYNDSATDAAIIVPIGLVLGDVEVTGDGREAERWNRCRKNGQISTLYPPQSPISKKSFGEKLSGYMRWSKEGRCMKILYFKVRLSTRNALFMDRCHNFALVSTEMPLFMDITAKPSVLSTKSCGSMDTTPFSSSFLAYY